jgi:hypothetical protein
MKSILSAGVLALAFAVTLGAQSSSPTQTQSPDQPKSKSTMGSKNMSSKSVTLSGCVREGDEPNTFVLANVDMSEMARMGGNAPHEGTAGSSAASGTSTGGSTAGQSASGSASGAMDSTKTVKLVGSSNLKDHVGHQVQVTGTMTPHGKGAKGKTSGTSGSTSATGSAAGETTTDTTSRAGERGMSGDQKNMPTVSVRSVKMVSANCSTE